MRIVLGRIGSADTVKFAMSELARYIKMIDSTATVDERVYPAYDAGARKVIFIGLLDGAAAPEDRIAISIREGEGYISGSNERSVLFAVYRLLGALGCRWVRPGKDGELIPKRRLSAEDFTLCVSHEPPYKHRGICIEGANKYENALDMIDWMPKVGLNEYFMQFHIPYTFFERWYTHHEDGAAPFTTEDAVYLDRRLEEEISLRGFKYQKVGHGWTYSLVGKQGAGWYDYEEPLPEQIRAMTAEIGGKRGIWKGSLFNTNLCYSNPEVRRKFIGGIVDYCREHPKVDYIHFWLADELNNQCECAECQRLRPSDYYVMMLNELDELLSAEGIRTKIVFLIYFELLWAPLREKIKNQDRFVLMFAPISRSYKQTYVGAAEEAEAELPPFVRNGIVLPREVSKNLYALRSWQRDFSGESFLFDYHVMWDFQLDAGCYRNARVMHDDMKNLKALGLDGMVSCQLQRVASPTCLSTYAMARALWDAESDFGAVAQDYFRTSFDRHADEVEQYLSDLSRINDSEDEDKHERLAERITAALPLIRENYERTAGSEFYHMSWAYLLRHSELWLLITEAFAAIDDAEALAAATERCYSYIAEVEDEVQRGFDGYQFVNSILKNRLGLFKSGENN